MEIAILEPADGIEMLVPLLTEWEEVAGGFGVHLSWPTTRATINNMVHSGGSDVLVLMLGDQAVGFMGILLRSNHVGSGLIAQECLYFVSPQHRHSARRLVTAAEKWAKSRGASHLVLTASALANPEGSGRVARYYQALGFAPYETTWIKGVA